MTVHKIAATADAAKAGVRRLITTVATGRRAQLVVAMLVGVLLGGGFSAAATSVVGGGGGHRDRSEMSTGSHFGPGGRDGGPHVPEEGR